MNPCMDINKKNYRSKCKTENVTWFAYSVINCFLICEVFWGFFLFLFLFWAVKEQKTEFLNVPYTIFILHIDILHIAGIVHVTMYLINFKTFLILILMRSFFSQIFLENHSKMVFYFGFYLVRNFNQQSVFSFMKMASESPSLLILIGIPLEFRTGNFIFYFIIKKFMQ